MMIVGPIAFALLVWWLGTSLVLALGRLPDRLERPARYGAAAVYVLTTGGLIVVQRDPGVAATYAAFTLAVASWGALELAYFRGWLTGPTALPCPPQASSGERFHRGVMTSLHHELAVIATAGLLLTASWSDGQSTGTATFVLLWLMRWSAKLNLFLGVRNFSTHLLPEPMRYLDTYVRRARMNALFPFSMIAALAVLATLLTDALAATSPPAVQAHGLLLATLLALAVIEHLLLMVPISDRWLWQWAIPDSPQREVSR